MIRKFIKKVGTGPHGVRDLDFPEAFDSAELILSGSATPAQTGALLLGLRLKGETGEEMAGYLEALRKRLPPSPLSGATEVPDLDIGDPYDGRSRSVSLVVPAALYAARFGVRSVLHGLSGVPVKQGPGVLEAWNAHGHAPTPYSTAREDLLKSRVVCLSQADFLPELSRLLTLRQELGLRTIFNTVEKVVNPLEAGAQIIGIFHAPVMEKLQIAFRNAREGNGPQTKKIAPERILFVCGPEGGTDLHPHRATICYLYDPWKGEDFSPVTIPAPSRNCMPSFPEGAQKALPPSLDEILEGRDHPYRLALERQTAFFLFASGRFATFTDAAQAVSDATSGQREPGPFPMQKTATDA